MAAQNKPSADAGPISRARSAVRWAMENASFIAAAVLIGGACFAEDTNAVFYDGCMAIWAIGLGFSDRNVRHWHAWSQRWKALSIDQHEALKDKAKRAIQWSEFCGRVMDNVLCEDRAAVQYALDLAWASYATAEAPEGQP